MRYLLFIILFLLCGLTLLAQTKVALLGTGTPNPDPGHSGGSVASIIGTTS